MLKSGRHDGPLVGERRGGRGYFWRESMWDFAEEGYGYRTGGYYACK